MRTILILISLFVCLNIFGQQSYCEYNLPNKTYVESYVAGGILLSTFFIVNEVDLYLFDKYYPSQNFTAINNQRALTAVACVATSAASYFIIKKIRIKKQKRRY